MLWKTYTPLYPLFLEGSLKVAVKGSLIQCIGISNRVAAPFMGAPGAGYTSMPTLIVLEI